MEPRPAGSLGFLQVDRAVLHDGRVARDTLPRHRHAGAGAHVELPAVERTDHDLALDPAVAEATALMRAVVADGQDLGAAPIDAHIVPVHAEEHALAGWQLRQRQDLHAGHPYLPR